MKIKIDEYKKSRYIGTHIAMDITSYDADLLRDEGLVKKYLREVIELAEMTVLVDPTTFSFPHNNEYINFLRALKEEGTTSPLIKERLEILEYNETEGSGITGFAVLCESHIATHSFPEKIEPFLSVCLYSCKEYDSEKIIDYTQKWWKASRMDMSLLNRYIGIPQDIVQDTRLFERAEYN